MFLDHPAAKIFSGVAIGGLFGVLAFATVHVAPAGTAPAEYAAAPVPAEYAAGQASAVVTPQTVPVTFMAAGAQAPVSSPGGPLLLPPAPRVGPRRARLLLTQQATFACAARPGASKVKVGWALSLSAENATARLKAPRPAAGAAYATSLSWGGEGMSLAVSCSPGIAAARSAAYVAQRAPAPRPMVPLDYPAEAQPMGLQMAGLFKPVTDAMP